MSNHNLFERKSIFAKLLAKENIHVVLGEYETASFDVLNRVLKIPHWDGMTIGIYDMFVAHEVSHALNTPTDKWGAFLKEGYRNTNSEVLKSYVNIVEDVRIEKIMGRIYPGLEKKFIAGYKDIMDLGVWDDVLTKAKNKKLSFADRINIKAKFRTLVDVDFSVEEQKIVDLINSTETFEDVLEASKTLIDFDIANKKREISKVIPLDFFKGGVEYNEDDEDITDEDITDYEDCKKSDKLHLESDVWVDKNDEDGDEDGEDEDEDEDGDILDSPFTLSIHDRWIKKSIDESPIKTVTVMNDEIFEKTIIGYHKAVELRQNSDETKEVEKIKYNTWVKLNRKRYMPMVQEFERKRAAKSYARATQSDKGSIDTKKLHEYKFNDKIFKVVNNIQKGKSHGMVMLVDFSGSMTRDIRDVMDQTLVLVNFCKNVNIPYDVYYFTNIYKDIVEMEYTTTDNALSAYNSVKMVQLTSSTLSKNDKLASEAKMLALGSNGRISGNFDYMNGTPLFEAVCLAAKALKNMKIKNNLDHVSLIALTDGDGNHVYEIDDQKVNMLFDNKLITPSTSAKKSYSHYNSTQMRMNDILEFCKSMGADTINFFVTRATKSGRGGKLSFSGVGSLIGRSINVVESKTLKDNGVIKFSYVDNPIMRYAFDDTIILYNETQATYNPYADGEKNITTFASGAKALNMMVSKSAKSKKIAKYFIEGIV